MRSYHSFDWNGFKFSGMILFLCLAIGVAGHLFLLSGTVFNRTPTPPASGLVTEKQPLVSQAAFALSTTTPQRVISTLTIADVVPPTGKFIAADLTNMTVTLYQDGLTIGAYPILTKGRPGSPYETPSGFYTLLTKEEDHFNSAEQVHMPWSMQFYGNYFIHGWPFNVDGTPVNPNYSGGCIRLSTDDAEKVYDFSTTGTGIFVYDATSTASTSSIALGKVAIPAVSAAAYLVADIDTGDVFAERKAQNPFSIASLTKLMTALVANETILFTEKVAVTKNELLHMATSTPGPQESFVVGDLLYPLLMESNNAIAQRLAEHYGSSGFIAWMNSTAKSLDMPSTHFDDPIGISPENVSTTDDLFRFATYLVNKKSFIFDITRTPSKRLVAESGNAYQFNNFNLFYNLDNFIGGKVGVTPEAGDTMVSVFRVPVNGVARRVAIIVLKSDNFRTDTTALYDWFTRAAEKGVRQYAAACVNCATPTALYRKIEP
jgi:D-alanyl-D-alanine carboxypeptidase